MQRRVFHLIGGGDGAGFFECHELRRHYGTSAHRVRRNTSSAIPENVFPGKWLSHKPGKPFLRYGEMLLENRRF